MLQVYSIYAKELMNEWSFTARRQQWSFWAQLHVLQCTMLIEVGRLTIILKNICCLWKRLLVEKLNNYGTMPLRLSHE